MKTIFSLLSTLMFTVLVHAQQDAYCGLTKLFSLHIGLSKEAIIDSVKLNYNIQQLRTSTTTGSNERKNGAREFLIYKLQNNSCLQGNNTSIQFEFINNKLVNAFIQTEFARADYYALNDNFTALRNMLKQNWQREKETKNASDNLMSTGFVYSKSRNESSNIESILLHYINTKPGKGYGIYLLRLNWVNNTVDDTKEIAY